MLEKFKEFLRPPVSQNPGAKKPQSSAVMLQALSSRSESQKNQPKNSKSSKDLPPLTHFRQNSEGNLIDAPNNVVLKKGFLLEGRGQPGLAGFFGEPNHQLLIKVDDPATCVMEGSAGFARSVIPKGYESSVNFAHAGRLSQNDKDEMSSAEDVISIQRKAEGYQAWDKIIYGKKRDPKTVVSYENRYQDKVFNNIENMSDQAQTQLSVAIFASTMVGDESLHTGQFMAKTDKNGHVTDIMRIDFGARERFSLERQEKKDFKHETSDAYKNSGQFGKDYISYLLSHPDVNAKYLSLWAREMDIDALGEKSKQEFIEQINNIPEEKREEALKGVWETLSKKSNAIKPDPLDSSAIGELLKNIVVERAQTMQNSARLEIAKKLNSALSNSGIDSVVQDNIKAIVLHWENSSSPVQNIVSMIKYLDNNLEDMNSNQLIQLNKALSYLQASRQLSDNPHQKEILNKIDRLKSKISVITELNAYLDHLNEENKSFISPDKKTLESKIETVKNAINDLKTPGSSVEKIITDDFLEKISKSRGLASGKGAKLAQRLETHLEKGKEPEAGPDKNLSVSMQAPI